MLTDNGPTDDDLAAYTGDRDSPVTAHPIDTEAIRASALEELEYAEPASTRWWIRETLGVLDALAAAEHRATRAEAQSEARRINAEYWKDLARGRWARIKVVRELHTPFEDKDCGTICAECSYFGGDYGLYPTDYPCDTIRALDGTVSPRDAG